MANRHFSSFLIRCLRLWRGQHRMQGKPCCARAFADLPRTPQGALSCPCGAIHLVSPKPNPNKAIRGCCPLSTPGFFDRLDGAFQKEGLFVCRLFLQKIPQHSFRVVEKLLCDYIMLGVFVIGTLYAIVAQLVYLCPGVRHEYWRVGADDEL